MKRTYWSLIIVLAVTLGLIVSYFTGRTPHKAYFPLDETASPGIKKLAPDDGASTLLGVIEVNDEGEFADGVQERQIAPILEAISKKPTQLVLFVHGWFNDASGQSYDLARFEKFLTTELPKTRIKPEDEEASEEQQQVVGVFLAWRGRSNTMPGLRYLSYGDRYRTAVKISQSDGVRKILGQLIRSSRKHSRSSVTLSGHSMGALILEGLYAAHLKKLLADDDSADGAWIERNRDSIPDSVLLLNSAADYRESSPNIELFAQAHATMFPPGSHFQKTTLHRPVVTYLTSMDDQATGWVHRVGQVTGMLRLPGPSVGHLPKLWTHRPEPVNAEVLKAGGEAVEATLANYRDMFYFHPQGEHGYSFLKTSYHPNDNKPEPTSHEHHLIDVFSDQGKNSAPCIIAGRNYPRWNLSYHPIWNIPIQPELIADHGDVWSDRLHLLAVRFSQFTRLPKPATDKTGELGELIRELARPANWGDFHGNVPVGWRRADQAKIAFERRVVWVSQPTYVHSLLGMTRDEWSRKSPMVTPDFDYSAGIEKIDGLLGMIEKWGKPSTPYTPWRTVEPDKTILAKQPMGKIQSITIHHTQTPIPDSVSEIQRLRNIQHYHQEERGWGDIAYHYLIGPSGNVYQGRSEEYAASSGTVYLTRKLLNAAGRSSTGHTLAPRPEGSNPPGQSDGHLTFCFIGDFSETLPSQEARQSMAALVAQKLKANRLDADAVYFHREVASATDCPGQVLYDWFRGKDGAEAEGMIMIRNHLEPIQEE